MSDEPNPMPKSGPDNFFDAASNADLTADAVEHFLDAGTVDAVYGEPVVHGDSMIIPAAEIISAFGVGYGGGGGMGEPAQAGGEQPSYGGGGGGGGGGRIFSRPVAIIISDIDGVRVEPVFDITKIGLAALTAFGFMAGMYFRMRSPKNMEQALRRQWKETRG